MVVQFTFNREPLERAMKAVKTVTDTNMSIRTKINSLPKVSAEADGTKGVQQRQKEIDDLNANIVKAADEARKAIEKAERDFTEDIDLVTLPNGKDFQSADGKADFDLLQNSLIRTEPELEAVLNRHLSSAAFRRMIERYAEQRAWTNLSIIADNTNKVKEFSDSIFADCYTACNVPDGYAALVVTAPDELTRRMTAAGVQNDLR